MHKNTNSFSARLKSTYKSSDTEEWWDKVFTRPIGFALALAAKKMRVSPNAITIFSIFIGVIGTHFLYYHDLALILIGCAIITFANILDSTDGQLARMTNNCSQLGRFLDGIGGNFIFGSVYIHLFLKYYQDGASPYTAFIFLFAAVFHSYQSALADFLRNAHLYFIGKKNEVTDFKKADAEYKAEKSSSWRKIWFFLYRNYARQQMLMTPNLRKLLAQTKKDFPDKIPNDISNRFRSFSKPLLKYGNILTTNTRLVVLFILVIVDLPLYYPIFELTIMNLLFFYMMFKNDKESKKMLNIYFINDMTAAGNEA